MKKICAILLLCISSSSFAIRYTLTDGRKFETGSDRQFTFNKTLHCLEYEIFFAKVYRDDKSTFEEAGFIVSPLSYETLYFDYNKLYIYPDNIEYINMEDGWGLIKESTVYDHQQIMELCGY